MTYNSLQGIFTTMIGFVTWPPYTYIKDDSTIILVAYIVIIVASDWPRTFFTARLFMFSISLLFVSIQKQII